MGNRDGLQRRTADKECADLQRLSVGNIYSQTGRQVLFIRKKHTEDYQTGKKIKCELTFAVGSYFFVKKLKVSVFDAVCYTEFMQQFIQPQTPEP